MRSAALEMLPSAAALAGGSLEVHDEIPKRLEPLELALLGQRVENEFVGVACGILDQYSSVMGQEALEAADVSVDEATFDRLASNLCYVSGDYRDRSTFDDIAIMAPASALADSPWSRCTVAIANDGLKLISVSSPSR